MTKQEVIRRRVERHIRSCLEVSGAKTSTTFAKSVSTSLVFLLDGLGVVIRKELSKEGTFLIVKPKYPDEEPFTLTNCWVISDKCEMVAVDPLIKEEK